MGGGWGGWGGPSRLPLGLPGLVLHLSAPCRARPASASSRLPLLSLPSRGLPIMVGGPTATMGQIPEVIALWHERMEHYGHPHDHIDLGVAQNIYVAPTMEEAETDIAGLEEAIDAEFLRIGNPKNATGALPKGFEQWKHRDQDRIYGGEKARELGIMPLVGTPEVVCERIEVLRGLGINSIRGNFGKAGLDQGKMRRCMHMFSEEVMPHFGGAQ